MSKLNVLLTGPGGRMGKYIVPAFQERYNLRTLDRHPTPLDPNAIISDLQDINVLKAAMEGIEVVVHLAATSDEAPVVENLIPNNVVGTYNVFEAAHQMGVRRIVYASTCQTVSSWKQEAPVEIDAPPRPVTVYGVTKVFGESLGRFYHDYRGMEFAGIRIGAFQGYDSEYLRTKVHTRELWLSPNDAIRLFNLTIEKPDIGYVLVFGTSMTTRERLGRESAERLLGFVPEDFAADWVDGGKYATVADAAKVNERLP